MQCPKCQFENPDGIKFCGECGAKLERIAIRQTRFSLNSVVNVAINWKFLSKDLKKTYPLTKK